MPNDWPVTLPPTTTQSEAKSHDFRKDLIRLRLQGVEARLAQNPTDQRLLAAAGSYYLKLNNHPAAEAVFQRFFATGCRDAIFLNIVVYEYADNGGTNLDRAYELALKAEKLAQGDPSQLPYIDDTVAWILLKRGYYDEAIRMLTGIKVQFTPEVPAFHLGVAHYMLMDEELARKAFLQVLDYQKAAQNSLPRSRNPRAWESKETREAKGYLAVLDTKVDRPRRGVAAELEARRAGWGSSRRRRLPPPERQPPTRWC